MLVRNYKSHKAYIDKSNTVSETAKPIRLKESINIDFVKNYIFKAPCMGMYST